MTRVLITGGAGFIGSHVADLLLESGYDINILDNFEPQVHGPISKRVLRKHVKLTVGDIRDPKPLRLALRSVDFVIHLAAAVGSGQSFYETVKYVDVNCGGTANLLSESRAHQVKKVVVASSMSVYGEGSYVCSNCGVVYPRVRSVAQLKSLSWEVRCPNCDAQVKPIPTNEEKPLRPTTIYGVTKRDQEELSLTYGAAFDIPTIAFRPFTVYGPRQSLSNPYAGVLAIFASRVMANESPIVFEDGKEVRDFVYVKDVAKAYKLALERNVESGPFNLGTGVPESIVDVAKKIIKQLSSSVEPELQNTFRPGEVRHCFADMTKFRSAFGFIPSVTIDEGLSDTLEYFASLPRQVLRNHLRRFKKERAKAKKTGMTL